MPVCASERVKSTTSSSGLSVWLYSCSRAGGGQQAQRVEATQQVLAVSASTPMMGTPSWSAAAREVPPTILAPAPFPLARFSWSAHICQRRGKALHVLGDALVRERQAPQRGRGCGVDEE